MVIVDMLCKLHNRNIWIKPTACIPGGFVSSVLLLHLSVAFDKQQHAKRKRLYDIVENIMYIMRRIDIHNLHWTSGSRSVEEFIKLNGFRYIPLKCGRTESEVIPVGNRDLWGIVQASIGYYQILVKQIADNFKLGGHWQVWRAQVQTS